MENNQEIQEFGEETSGSDLINESRAGKKLHKQFIEAFNTTYLISGKPISYWKNYFYVEIPQDVNPQTAKVCASKLNDLYQEASDFKATAESAHCLMKERYDDHYRAQFVARAQEFQQDGKKLPAKDTLVLLTENQPRLKQIKASLVHAEIEVSFWKEIIGRLAASRKHLEMSTMNIGIEAKALMLDHKIDKYGSNGQQNYL